MSRLFKLREWLDLEDAATHISNVLGEPAKVSDLYRFAVDGHLQISVNFVNHVTARKGKWIVLDNIECDIKKHFQSTGEMEEFVRETAAENRKMFGSEYGWIDYQRHVTEIDGVWDLVMYGAETLDIEQAYQALTSGLAVTSVCIDGVYLRRGEVFCQLQTDFEDNELMPGSRAHRKNLERHIADQDLADHEAKELRDKFDSLRKEFLFDRENGSEENNYFPSGGLSEHDYVFVIRTKEITRFIQSLEETPESSKPLTSNERNSLLVLIGAMCENVGIDPKQRGVAASLVKMTEISGTPLTDDTIRKILKQIEGAATARSK